MSFVNKLVSYGNVLVLKYKIFDKYTDSLNI